MVPSHAVTYVSQGLPPEDDIVSVILLLYNPITKCPVHLHAYRCDSVETADLLRQQLQVMTRQTQPQSTQPLGSAVLNLCVRRRRTTERRPDLFFFLPRTISPTVSVAKKKGSNGFAFKKRNRKKSRFEAVIYGPFLVDFDFENRIQIR